MGRVEILATSMFLTTVRRSLAIAPSGPSTQTSMTSIQPSAYLPPSYGTCRSLQVPRRRLPQSAARAKLGSHLTIWPTLTTSSTSPHLSFSRMVVIQMSSKTLHGHLLRSNQASNRMFRPLTSLVHKMPLTAPLYPRCPCQLSVVSGTFGITPQLSRLTC